MDKGVKRLSILNMTLAISLMMFVFFIGPSIHILESFLAKYWQLLKRYC